MIIFTVLFPAGEKTFPYPHAFDGFLSTNDAKVLRQERYSGTMQRSFYVGDSVTEEDIKAKYENGVLSLTIPKKEQQKVSEKKQILIEG